MPIHKTEAIIIRRMDFRETSLIADFYTRDFGKLSGLFKGIRTDPKKFASSVEISSYNDVIFYKKSGASLHLVSACDLKDNFFNIRRNIMKAGMMGIMVELIASVMQPEDKNEEVFNLALECLKELEITSTPEKIMTIFKIKMLALSGFKPHFDSCVSCSNRIMGQSRFSLSLGGLLCEGCFHKDKASRSIFRGTIASILYIEKNNFKNNLNLGLNPQIKKELELILNAFLNFHLEKELKSQKVLNKLTALA
ncbi:MAG: DNA repair protein RecO [Candidatus Omnitrophica bacterium]|nr:DNA repair protein RecO [Candidatus Omnitrophota bacterium]